MQKKCPSPKLFSFLFLLATNESEPGETLNLVQSIRKSLTSSSAQLVSLEGAVLPPFGHFSQVIFFLICVNRVFNFSSSSFASVFPQLELKQGMFFCFYFVFILI